MPKLSREVVERALGGVRFRIDLLDDEVVALLERRLALSLEAQLLKEEAGWPTEDREREEAIVRRALLGGHNPEVAAMLGAIVEICRLAGADRRAASATSPASGGSSTRP